MIIYNLMVFPVDHALTVEEAVAEVDRLAGGWQIGLRRDHRLDAFVERVDGRWPGLRNQSEMERPFEFDVMRHHVFVGIPPGGVEEALPIVAEAAWSSGLAVFDPQRQLVGLPAPFADAPLGIQGIAELLGAVESDEPGPDESGHATDTR